MGAVSGYVQRRNKKKFKELYSPPPSFLLSYLVTGDETGRKEDQRVYVGGKRICKAAKASYKQRRSKKKIRFRDLYYLNTPPHLCIFLSYLLIRSGKTTKTSYSHYSSFGQIETLGTQTHFLFITEMLNCPHSEKRTSEQKVGL